MLPTLALLLALQDPDPKQVDAWIRDLRSDDVAVRAAVTKKLLDCGGKLLPLLEKYEKSEDAEVRARVADLRERLTPFKIDDLFAAAEAALQEKSDAKEWRPRLQKIAARYVDLIGDDAPPGRAEDLKHALGVFERSLEVVRENRDRPEDITLVVGEAKASQRAHRSVVICGAAKLDDDFDECVVICLSDVACRKVKKSILFAKGRIEAAEAEKSSVFCGGTLSCSDKARENAILALGGSRVGRDSRENVFINAKDRKAGRSEKDRDVEKPRLPANK